LAQIGRFVVFSGGARRCDPAIDAEEHNASCLRDPRTSP